jgi:ATP-dependent Lhr-like helicase
MLPGEPGSRLVTVFPRASGHLFLEAADHPPSADSVPLAGDAQRVYQFLRSEGTASSSDIRDALGDLPLTRVRDALAEVAARGLLTADSWIVLASLDDTLERRSGRRGAATEPEVGYPGPVRGGRRRDTPLRAAARAVREAASALPPGVRWSVSSRFAVMGGGSNGETSESARASARAEALADRYGVVTRHALANEASPWAWGQIVTELSLRELRGQVRRGYFVAGLPGLQYARNDVLDELREGLPGGAAAAEGPPAIELVNASDPSFVLDRALFESAAEFPEPLRGLTRIPSTWVAFAGDMPVLLAEDSGRRIVADDSSRAREAVYAALGELSRVFMGGGMTRVAVETWNGKPVLASAGAELLAGVGFRRDYPGMVYDQVQARAGGMRQTRPA